MNKLRRARGQAMTELVIVIPVFFLMFGGIFKFAMMGIHKIQLEITAHEVMRYIADGVDFGEDMAGLEKFAKEAGARNGLKRENIRGPVQTGETAKGNFGGKSVADGLVAKFSGVTFDLFYKEDLKGFFWKVVGNNGIELKTTLATASGGSFAVTWKTIAKNNGNMSQDSQPVVDYGLSGSYK